jgi:hypothetical protein
MNPKVVAAFESIESAQEYLSLLAETIIESQQMVQADTQERDGLNSPRQVEALRVIGYNLEKLAYHVKISRRILNDLRMLRRVLRQGDGGPAS